MFGALYAADGTAADALLEVAPSSRRAIESCGPREVVLDLTGSSGCLAMRGRSARNCGARAADRGLRVRVAIAGTRTAARLLVRHRARASRSSSRAPKPPRWRRCI